MLTLAIVLVAVGSDPLPGGQDAASMGRVISAESQLLEAVDLAQDHIEPEELADRMLNGEPGLVVVDIRPIDEYLDYHLPNALNIPMKDLHQALMPYKNVGTIVLYSNGMTHPVQARDSLYRSGYTNVYILTDGLNGFIERCLTPVSLRDEVVPPETAGRIRAWRSFFLGSIDPPAKPVTSDYPVADRDRFSVDYRTVLEYVRSKKELPIE